MPRNSKPIAELIQRDAGQFQLCGDLTLASVGLLARDTKRLFTAASNLTIDLSGIQQVHSAGLALLLDWQQQASRTGCQLKYVNWPVALVRIAALSNLDTLLGLHLETAPIEAAISHSQ
ncbi:STAS domain-containing protein [Rhodoferax sp. 4810]|uniref:STAS domain-containing protein n=1 Tax=Thiospirillum jenense TaxID=1653858 RepID=A0A839HJC3_9GAMM|nr:STAS domain-containing protein [Thiospirillum jenense]MBB1075884.1 STAS domain-containing protein [Rhodoferax jenense]MBB1126092.1 STAS domain-containing protein [Thiospirillum jenense]